MGRHAAGFDRDLLVVGGGPAGAAAATVAARAGLSVAVHDKAAFPRDKTCGDGLTASALRWLEALGLDPAGVGSWTVVRETVLVSPSGRRVTLPLPDDGVHVAIAPRRDLDAAVLALARSAGAEVRESSAVTGVRTDHAGVTAWFADGTRTRARYLVAADGMFSSVRRLLVPGRAPELGEAHAFRQYFRGVTERRIWVIFEPDLLPGYAWVFPAGPGRANVGFGIHRVAGMRTRMLAGLWRDLLARPSLREVLAGAEPEGPHRAWPIPADLHDGDLAYGRVLFAGDAAAVADPMTGEGIAQALATGARAAEVVAGALAGGDQSALATRQAYVRQVRRELGLDHRFARMLLGVLRYRNGARAAIRTAGLNGWTRRNFARWLFEDYPRALVLTPRRWHRGMFRAPGAFRGTHR